MLPDVWYFDWTTFWLLSGITLAEGFRRVPAGSLLLRRVTGYPWQVGGGPYAQGGLRLASAFSPLALHLLVPAGGTREAPDARRLRFWVTLLRIPSFLALVALLVGVPLLSASMALTGLIIAVVAAFGLSLLTALVAFAAGVRLKAGWKRAALDALRMLSPFTAPRAPEIVLERAMTGVAPADAARLLLPPAAFTEWVRPLAYDQVMRGADAVLPPREAEDIVRAVPVDVGDDAWCPRCAGTYLPTAECCHACEVPLQRAATPADAPEPMLANR